MVWNDFLTRDNNGALGGAHPVQKWYGGGCYGFKLARRRRINSIYKIVAIIQSSLFMVSYMYVIDFTSI